MADEATLRRRQEEIAMQLANLDEAEVSYLYCIEPLAKEVPLFNAYGKWLTATLTYQGLESWKASQVAIDADKECGTGFGSTWPRTTQPISGCEITWPCLTKRKPRLSC